MGRIWMATGALAGAGAVGMAALAAHALPGRLGAQGMAAVQGAVQMQGWHALALLVAGAWLGRAGRLAARLGHAACAGFCAGMLLFCGSIYAHHLAGIAFGPAAPVGGVSLMAAWLLLAAAALRDRQAALPSGPAPVLDRPHTVGTDGQ